MSRLVIVIGLLALAIGIGGAGYGVWTIWNQHRVISSARPVRAKVVGHETKDLKASGFVAKVPLVKYEYTVDQRRYMSDTVTPSEFMLPDTWAQSVFQQFPVGAETEAKYDPSDPSKSFLIGKYSASPYLPLLVSLVVAAMGLGVVGEQLMNHDAPAMAPSGSGAITLVAKQHHLARPRVLGAVGVVGLVFGAPAIAHHLMVSTAPHERMGFLLEGAYAVAVLVLLARSAIGFRQGAGFGSPVVTMDRSPAVGRPVRLNVSVPTRFNGTVQLNGCLQCEAKDTRLFSASEENSNTVLLKQHFSLAESKSVVKGGEVTGTAELNFPAHLPSTTSVGSRGTTQVVWSLVVSAEGSGGRHAETVYILSVASALLDHQDARDGAGAGSRSGVE